MRTLGFLATADSLPVVVSMDDDDLGGVLHAVGVVLPGARLRLVRVEPRTLLASVRVVSLVFGHVMRIAQHPAR